MEKERHGGLEDPFENDDLDTEVLAADDTGMLASQQVVIEQEIARGEAGELPDEGSGKGA